MANLNKVVIRELKSAITRDVKDGRWKKLSATLSSDGNRIISFSLFDMQDVELLYAICAHETLKQMGFNNGVYENKRSQQWESTVRGVFAQMKPIGTKELKVGQTLIMTKSPDFSGVRWATLVEEEYMTSIVDVSIHEKNGYFPDTGSAYVWEIMCVRIDADAPVWSPFHLTDEEDAFKCEVNTMFG